MIGTNRRSAARRNVAAYACVALLGAVGLYFHLLGPRLDQAAISEISSRLGFAGVSSEHYLRMTADPWGVMVGHDVPSRNLIRFAPSLIAGVLSGAWLGAAPSSDYVIATYSVLNLVLVVAAGVVWLRIARSTELGARAAALGTGFLFFSYAMLRQPFIVAVTTDYFALFLAMLSLWAYVNARTGVLAATTVVAMFTWPVALLLNAAMLAMPFHRLASPDPSSVAIARIDRAGRAVAVLAFAMISVYFIFLHPVPTPFSAEQVDVDWAPLSVALTLAYVAWCAKAIAVSPLMRRNAYCARGVLWASACALVYSAVRWFLETYSAAESAIDIFYVLRYLAGEPAVRPALFVVSHVVYWGPWVLLWMALLPRVSAVSANHPALHVAVALFAILFAYTESRVAIYCLPAVMFCLVQGIPARITWIQIGLLLALSFVASRFWIPLARAGGFESPLEFPAQWLFMQIGPWMGVLAYWAALAQTAVIAVTLYAIFKLPQRTHDRTA
jgi:hypothetical protein